MRAGPQLKDWLEQQFKTLKQPRPIFEMRKGQLPKRWSPSSKAVKQNMQLWSIKTFLDLRKAFVFNPFLIAIQAITECFLI